MVSFRLSGERPQAEVGVAPFHQWLAPDATPWTLFFRQGDDYLLRFPGFADFEVSADGRAVSGWRVGGVSEATVSHLYLNQVLPLALSKNTAIVLHASAVDVHGAGIAFVGTTGQGKSTLAVSFANHGCACLADDGLVVTDDGDGYSIAPGHPSIRLWEDSERSLVGIGAPKAPPLEYTAKERFLASDRIAFCDTGRPLDRIYLLDGPTPAAVDIERAEPATALVALISHSFLLETEAREALSRHFDALSALVERTPCFSLRYPRRYDALDRVRHAIVEHASA